MLSDEQLRKIMPALPPPKRQLYLPHLNLAMQACGIDNPLRTAAFVAQLAHESGELRWMEEIWGPTPAQRRYEPPSDLASKLGNTQSGDGKRFKGRGPIQITGRFNYKKFGELLGVDLCANPALAMAPEVAFATAGLFWQSNGLNALADAQQFVAITRRINGGTNGLEDRQGYYERAKAVLGVVPVARGMVAMKPLKRGVEAIRAAGQAPPPAKKAVVKKTTVKNATVKNATVKKTASKKAMGKRGAPKKATKRNAR
jgi:putative chitinase